MWLVFSDELIEPSVAAGSPTLMREAAAWIRGTIDEEKFRRVCRTMHRVSPPLRATGQRA